MTLSRLALLAFVAASTGCFFDLDNPFDTTAADLTVSPAEVGRGVSILEVTDAARETDFRDVWDVGSLGDFVVLDWSSNDDELTVEIDVLDGADGEQDLVIELENENEPVLVPFVAQ